MVTKIHLIRHGETEGADKKRYKGHINVPLSEEGVRQIQQLAEHMCSQAVKRGSTEDVNAGHQDIQTSALSAVYCSDLSRAVRSAEIIAEPFGLKPVVKEGLRERNFGEWEGMNFNEVKARWPDAFNAWAANPLRYSPIGGESTLEARDRAMRSLEEILRASELQRSPSNIAVVSHGGVNRIILCELLGIPLENIFRIEQDFGCLNIIEFHDGYPVVKLLNGRIE